MSVRMSFKIPFFPISVCRCRSEILVRFSQQYRSVVLRHYIAKRKSIGVWVRSQYVIEQFVVKLAVVKQPCVAARKLDFGCQVLAIRQFDGPFVYAFSINPDGTLSNKQAYGHAHFPTDGKGCALDGQCSTTSGHASG